MYKFIDCGTYLWFVKKSHKYFHCVYYVNGEHKRLKLNAIRKPLYLSNDKMKYAYLKNWNLDTAKCNISNYKITYRKMLKNWRHLNKTSYMKEVLQQLKLGEKNDKSNGNSTS